jgi:hypothetical protein
MTPWGTMMLASFLLSAFPSRYGFGGLLDVEEDRAEAVVPV